MSNNPESIIGHLKLDSVPVSFYDVVTTYTAFAYAQVVNAPLIQSDETPMQAFVIVFIISLLIDMIAHFMQTIVNMIMHKPFKFALLTFFRIGLTSVRLATRGYGVRFMVASIGNTGYSGFVFVSLYQIILDYRSYFKSISHKLYKEQINDNNRSNS